MVLTPISRRYPPPKGRFLRVTHPFATLLTPKGFLVRLACVRHVASVHSEPGSNSPYQKFNLITRLFLIQTNFLIFKNIKNIFGSLCMSKIINLFPLSQLHINMMLRKLLFNFYLTFTKASSFIFK